MGKLDLHMPDTEQVPSLVSSRRCTGQGEEAAQRAGRQKGVRMQEAPRLLRGCSGFHVAERRRQRLAQKVYLCALPLGHNVSLPDRGQLGRKEGEKRAREKEIKS